MTAGFLCLETSASHPGLVQVRGMPDGPPPIPGDQEAGATDPEIRLVLRFHDLDAARMHAHDALRRHLVDADSGTYRVELAEAVACIQAIDLRHQQLYLDPRLDRETLTAVARRLTACERHQARVQLAWKIVGGLGIALLVILSFGF